LGAAIQIILYAGPANIDGYSGFINGDENFFLSYRSSAEDEIVSHIERRQNKNEPTVVLAEFVSCKISRALIGSVMDCNVPLVAVVSAVADGFKCLEYGATDMVVDNGGCISGNRYLCNQLTVHIMKAAERLFDGTYPGRDYGSIKGKIIAIGSSTGGTESVLEILKQFPETAPPVLLVLHMPPVFTKLYSERADSLCAVKVVEARDGDRLSNGLVFVAPGDYHMRLAKHNGTYRVSCGRGEKVQGQRPSADVLFESVAREASSEAVGVILTGMGEDGAKGLLQMKNKGAFTIGQDEKTSVVYGMPRAAYEMGAVETQLPLEKIAKEILLRSV